jgi:hypothetical protein
MIPVFVALMVFILVANQITINYDTQHRLIIVQSYENQLSSTLQQLYQFMSLDEIQTCTITKTNPLPQYIDGEPYTVTGTLNGEKLTLTVKLPGPGISHDVTVVLGSGVTWNGGTLSSMSADPKIVIIKTWVNPPALTMGFG